MSGDEFHQLQGIYNNRVEAEQAHRSRDQKQTLSNTKNKYKTVSNTLLKKLPSLVKIPLQTHKAEINARIGENVDYSGPCISQMKT